jgi:lysophosphatidylcholine acyltransferase/lyso-PAF acetyltransferase
MFVTCSLFAAHHRNIRKGFNLPLKLQLTFSHPRHQFQFSRRIKMALAQLGLSMWMLCGVGLIVKGKPAKRCEAPILVAAPHTTFLDAVIIHLTKLSSPIARQDMNLLGSKCHTRFV